jgi:putative sterol carrier protein
MTGPRVVKASRTPLHRPLAPHALHGTDDIVDDRTAWYTHLHATFTAEAARGLEAVYRIRCDDAPVYTVRIAEATLSCAEGEAYAEAAQPVVTLYFDSFANHRAILEGRMDPMQAFLDGRFRSDGHIVLAMRMLQVFVPQYARTRQDELT